jgi:MFS family permease
MLIQCSEQEVQTVKKTSKFLFATLPKEVWIGWVSSAVEAYNMAIYSFIAPMLATLLFQRSTGANALFFSYALVFIGACFLYPLGAFYYGLIGDKQGRQKTCLYSTLGLAAATALMGLVPMSFFTESAWIFFLVLLCSQYFFSGGEYYGSIVFSLEHCEEKKNDGLMSAFSCLFAVFGIVAANGMAALSISIGGEAWIQACFFAGGIGGLISYLLKNHCRETPAFSVLARETCHQADWLSFIQSEWRKVLDIAMVFAFFMVSYSFIFIFLPLGFNENSENFDTFKALIAYGFFLVAAGWLAGRIGVYTTMLIGFLSFSILVVTLCHFCNHSCPKSVAGAYLSVRPLPFRFFWEAQCRFAYFFLKQVNRLQSQPCILLGSHCFHCIVFVVKIQNTLHPLIRLF